MTTAFEEFIDRSMVGALRAFDRQWIVYLVLSVLLLGALAINFEADVDLFTRAAVGYLTEQLGTAPAHDPFAYSAKKEIWHDHEWLFGYLVFEIAKYLGDEGLFLGKYLVALATVILLMRAQRLQPYFASGPAMFLLAAGLFDWTSVWLLTVRAQIITYLCFSVVLFLVSRVEYDRMRERSSDYLLLLLTPLTIFWANCHGGFVVGVGLVCVYGGARLILRSLSPLLVASVLGVVAAPLVNPYGLSFLEFLFGAVSHLPTEITEWFPPLPWRGPGVLFYVLAGCAVVGIQGYRKVSLVGILFLLATFSQGAQHLRLTPLFTMTLAVFGVPLLAEAQERLERWLPRGAAMLRRAMFLVGGGFIFAAIALAVNLLWAFTTGFSLDYQSYPIAAIEWLRQNRPGGKILTHYNDGSYVLWRMGSRFSVSLDGRYDGVYPPSTIREGIEVYEPAHPNQGALLKKFDPDFVLLGRDSPGACAFRGSIRAAMFPGYGMVFSDGMYCVLERGAVVPEGDIAHGAPFKGALWRPIFAVRESSKPHLIVLDDPRER